VFEASIFTIVWFIIKIVIAIFIVFWGVMFIIGLSKFVVERSNGSVIKAIFKIILLFILGAILAYYMGEIVYNLFGNDNMPTAGGIMGLFLLLIYGFGNLIGSIYMSASIFAIIIWFGIIWFIGELMFSNKDERSKKDK